MRPHFIYNTLSSIYYLCEQNPKKAQEVVKDFNIYLRKNFTAISKSDLITFEEELEHTRAYLAVEKSRYEKLLFVDYDITYSDFKLPPLTLQPIVENAVKHGVDPEQEPLHINIHTEKTDDGSLITIENNGPPYEAASDGDVHIGISNVRTRLEMMCGGTLEITSKIGGYHGYDADTVDSGGRNLTKVTIFLPVNYSDLRLTP